MPSLEKTGKQGYAYYESASTFDAWLYSRGAEQLNADQTEAIFNGPESRRGARDDGAPDRRRRRLQARG